MISATSIKDRLKNQAVSSGKTFQEALTAYGLERTVYRLSVSEYVERFTLKGGIFLYALFGGRFARATSDIDLLVRNMPNDSEEMKRVSEEIGTFLSVSFSGIEKVCILQANYGTGNLAIRVKPKEAFRTLAKSIILLFGGKVDE